MPSSDQTAGLRFVSATSPPSAKIAAPTAAKSHGLSATTLLAVDVKLAILTQRTLNALKLRYGSSLAGFTAAPCWVFGGSGRASAARRNCSRRRLASVREISAGAASRTRSSGARNQTRELFQHRHPFARGKPIRALAVHLQQPAHDHLFGRLVGLVEELPHAQVVLVGHVDVVHLLPRRR